MNQSMRENNYKKMMLLRWKKSLGNLEACIYLENNEILSADKMLGIAKQHKGFVSDLFYIGY